MLRRELLYFLQIMATAAAVADGPFALVKETIFFLLVILLFTLPSSSDDKKPNIVIFFADNLAYDDVGTFQTTSNGNGKSRTPRTDMHSPHRVSNSSTGIHPQSYVPQVGQHH